MPAGWIHAFGWTLPRVRSIEGAFRPGHCSPHLLLKRGAFNVSSLQASIPFAVVGSNQQIEAKGKKVRGRLYPWGVVEVENPEHNDFLKLRTMLM